MFKKSLKFFCLIFVTTIVITACQNNTKVTETTVAVETTKEVIADAKPVLSNELFSVSVPAKFDGLYDTIVNDHTIDFYDLECKSEGNPGWVFGIQVFEKPDDWATGPTEKVGELKLNNGKLYDVIISYPTESQFGFGTDGWQKEMPLKYKNFNDARYEIAGTVSGKNGEKIVIGGGTKGENLYREQVNKHLTAIKESWDAAKLESENMSSMYAVIAASGENALEKVGFAYKDISQDGIDELLIGEIADGEWQGIIYDIYTMVDRKPAHVVSGWDRNRYFALQGSMVRNEYSAGANESGVNIYTLIGNSTELFLQVAYKYDGYKDEKNPWFRSYGPEKDENNNWESIKEEDYKEMEERFGQKEKIDYKPFSTLN